MDLTRRGFVGAAGLMAIGAPGVGRTETMMSPIPFAGTTPVRVSQVGLKARDAENLAGYYKAVVGLAELSRKPNRIVLGAGDKPILEIEQVVSAKPDDPRSAGLYHTAFLLPQRADLARWTRNAIDRRIPVDGASDHFVSEAIYLTDPEGNGVEIYADRPKELWTFENGTLRIGTAPLDFRDLLREADGSGETWQGAPQGSLVGHVHLRVGDVVEAEKFWNATMGFDTVVNYGGSAVFLSSGGYHHHIGANQWQSRGAGPRDLERTGLLWVELESELATSESEERDPWGNVVRTVPAKV